MRRSPEHCYAVENGLTWKGLAADTALDLYDRHMCFYHGDNNDFGFYRNDELLCQYLNVIFQDTYAAYRSRGIEVIELYRTEDMPYNPPPVLIIGTKEQILSIQDDNPYLWYVGLSVYHPILSEDSYTDRDAIDDTHICYNPRAEYNFEYMKWYYKSFIAPEGYDEAWYLEQVLSEWGRWYYKQFFGDLTESD